MAHQVSTKSSKITCLCGAVEESGSTLVAENFPITAGLCSCSICRQSTGSLGIIPIRLQGRPSSKSLAVCKMYKASDRAERYFCSRCGSHVFLRHTKADKWWTLAGVLDRDDDAQDIDTVKIDKIGFLSETRDGGIAARMRSILLTSDGTFADIKCYPRMPLDGTDMPLSKAEKIWQASRKTTGQTNEDVLCACHCGKVQFRFVQPDESRNDLEGNSKMLRDNKSKYLARLCVCRSCCLATSTPFMPWTYVMPENILTPDGNPVNLGFHAKLETLPGAQVYYSSNDTKRSFCSTCGATLFYEDENRPQYVDISLGIIRSGRGVLAEDVLEWDWPDVSWKDSGRNNNFLRSLMMEHVDH